MNICKWLGFSPVLLVSCAFNSPQELDSGEDTDNLVKQREPRTIRVAAVQVRGVAESLDANVAKASDLIRKAAAQGARYILLPELYALFPAAVAPKTIDEVRREAQPVPGPLTHHMVALARELDVYISFGMAEKRSELLYNTAVFVGPEGISGTYSKRALITHEGVRKVMEKMTGKVIPQAAEPQGPDERTIFAKGKKEGVVDWGGVRTGALICADGGFHNLWKDQADHGVELFCWPVANSGQDIPGDPTAEDICRQYGIPMVFANHLPKGAIFIGNSRIIDGEGNVLEKLGPTADQIVVSDIILAPRR